MSSRPAKRGGSSGSKANPRQHKKHADREQLGQLQAAVDALVSSRPPGLPTGNLTPSRGVINNLEQVVI